jgi:uncharacterized protein YbbK (DUF523 family)
MNKILISACLLGAPVRYHGGHSRTDSALLAQWLQEGRLVPVCPEVLGGLTTPRAPAEIQSAGSGALVPGSGSRVVDNQAHDVSEEFRRGAETAAAEATAHDIRMAILKEGSPSCGTGYIYDGSFSGRRVNGKGVTARLLESRGIRLFSEHQIEAAAAYLAELEQPLDQEP